LTYITISRSNRADYNTARDYEEKIVELTQGGYILCRSTTYSGVKDGQSVDSFSVEKVQVLRSSREPPCNDSKFPNGINLRVRNTRVNKSRTRVPALPSFKVSLKHGGKRKSNGEGGIPLDKHYDERRTSVTQLPTLGVFPYVSEYRGMLSAELLVSGSQGTRRPGNPGYSVYVGINSDKVGVVLAVIKYDLTKFCRGGAGSRW
jgi:hypothetical protein